MTVRTTLLVFCTLVSSNQVRGNDEISLAELVERHKATCESVRSLTAKYTYQQIDPAQGDQLIGNGTYSRARSKVYIKDGRPGTFAQDTLINSGSARSVWRNWTQSRVEQAATLQTSGEYISHGEVYLHMHLHGFPGPTSRKLSLEELYDLPGAQVRLSGVNLNDRECVLAEMRHAIAGSRVVVKHWHDVGHGYLIVRRELRGEDDDELLVAEVSDFQEQNGARFPARRRLRSIRGKALRREFLLILADVKINTPVPDKDLTLPPVPAGTECTDFTKMQVYRIGVDWKQSGPSRPHVVMSISAGPVDAAPDDPAREVSGAEQRGTFPWLLAASAGILICAALLTIVRRVKARRDSDI